MSMTSIRETDLDSKAVAEVSQALRQLLADVLTLFVKTKGFHWHVAGRHFRDYHLLLDELAAQISQWSMTSPSAPASEQCPGRLTGGHRRAPLASDSGDSINR